MATKKAQKGKSAGAKKSSKMKRGKALQPVKPLVSIPYGKIEIKYTEQVKGG